MFLNGEIAWSNKKRGFHKSLNEQILMPSRGTVPNLGLKIRFIELFE